MNEATIEQILETLASVDSSPTLQLSLDPSIYSVQLIEQTLARELAKVAEIRFLPNHVLCVTPNDSAAARLTCGLILSEALRISLAGAQA